MSTKSTDDLPSRPLSINEVLELKTRYYSVLYTAPLVGLRDEEKGQARESHAVVGAYVGIRGGAKLFGFDPESEAWQTPVVLSADEIGATRAMTAGIKKLMEWLKARYPGVKLVTYDGKSPRVN